MSADPDVTPTPEAGSPLARSLLASVVVFLVALPLCMGVAIASGVPPALGLISGIVGGIVVGALAGCPLQVSGPAAGLAVIVWEIVKAHGLAALGVIVLAAGALQILAGVLRIGQWFRAVSPAVIQGMLTGIGVLIIGSQFHVMLDHTPGAGGIENLVTIPAAIRDGLFVSGVTVHRQAALTGALTIAAILLWNLFAPKKLARIPGPLIGVILAVALASLFGFGIAKVEVPSDLLGSLEVGTTLGNLGILREGAVVVSVLSLALIASAETLLCATATDRLHAGDRTDYDKELMAQGAGNVVCGLFGALPVTGVIVRSTANIESGATSRASAVLHGVWLLLFVAALPFVLESIPVSALAAILVYIGFKLLNVPGLKELYREQGKAEVAILLATVVGIVATNLLTGIVIGFALSTLRLLWGATRLRVEVRHTDEAHPDPDRVDVDLYGAATFLGLPTLARELEAIPLKTRVEIHLQHLTYADAACLDFLVGYERRHTDLGGAVHVCWETLQNRQSAVSGRHDAGTLRAELLALEGEASEGERELTDRAPAAAQ